MMVQLEFKKIQNRTNAGFNTDGSDNTSPQYGFEEFRFTSSVATEGHLQLMVDRCPRHSR